MCFLKGYYDRYKAEMEFFTFLLHTIQILKLIHVRCQKVDVLDNEEVRRVAVAESKTGQGE